MKPWIRWLVIARIDRGGGDPVRRPSSRRHLGRERHRPRHADIPRRPRRPSSISTESPSPEPERTVIEVTFRDGAVQGPTSFSATQGDRVRIIVHAVSDEVHLHGYNLMSDVTPEQPARIDFVADVPGVLEVSSKTPASRCSSWRSHPDRRGAPRVPRDDVVAPHRRPGVGAREPSAAGPTSGPSVAVHLRSRNGADHLVRRALDAVDRAEVRAPPVKTARPSWLQSILTNRVLEWVIRIVMLLFFLVVVAMASARNASLDGDDRSDRRLRLVLGRARDRPRGARQPLGNALAVRHDRPPRRLRRRRGRRRGRSGRTTGVGVLAGGDPALPVRLGGARRSVREDRRTPRHPDRRLHADPDRRDAAVRAPAWLQQGEAFGVYFGLLAGIAPLTATPTERRVPTGPPGLTRVRRARLLA